MDTGEYIILQEIKASGSSFLQNLKIGDKVIVDFDNNNYKEAIVKSDAFAAPSGATYISILVSNKKYTVPIWDLYPLGSKKIVNKAYIYSLNQRGTSFSGRGSYELVFEGKRIKRVECCTGRKDANARLLDENMLKNYGINQVYSNYNLIYDAV